MTVEHTARPRRVTFIIGAALLAAGISMPAQQMVTETRDPTQAQDEDFAKAVKEWTTQPYFISPLVDHLPKVPGIPTPKDVLGYHIGAPAKLTYYADALKYYRALAAATPRVQDRDDRHVRRGPRAGGRVGLVGRQHQEPAAEPRQPRQDRRSARAVARRRSRSSSRRPSRTITSWVACTAARPGPPRC